MLKKMSFILVLNLFAISMYAQSDLSEQKIDSLIDKNCSFIKYSPNHLIYYIEGAWVSVPTLCYFDIDNGVIEFFYLFPNKTEKQKKYLKKKELKKINKSIINLFGVKNSIIHVDDGCIGKIIIYRDSKLTYSNYFIGMIPEENIEICRIIDDGR